MNIRIPPQVQAILLQLQQAGYVGYAVGGCVRDSLLGTAPQDWDICTSALPEQIQACFSRCLLTGVKFGTVTVLRDNETYEVTTFRAESGYSDSRHPDAVRFLSSLQEDLARRDFSINAMAADAKGEVTDLFDGLHDLRHGLIRCVGEPRERFSEDALRILRGLRFASRLGFDIEPRTAEAMHCLSPTLCQVSAERLRKELSGLLLGQSAPKLLEEFPDVLCVLLPELLPCIGFDQKNPHHKHDVYRHTLCALAQCPEDETLRLAVLLHDIGKPDCYQEDSQGIGHFYGHAKRSAELCEQILRRLRYDNKTVALVTLLVQEHDTALQPMTPKRLRRLLSAHGESILRRLFALRRADALGTGTADPAQVEAQTADWNRQLDDLLAEEGRFCLADLAVNGTDLMALGIPQGKQIGMLLHCLFDAVLEEKCPNERNSLVKYAQNTLNKQENH